MSLVSLMSSVLMSRNGINNSETNIFRSVDQINNGIRQAGNSPSFSANNLKTLHDRENNQMANLLTNSLMRKLFSPWEKSADKQLKENIKKSFSYYA